MALLSYLDDVKSQWNITLVVASVDHMLRGQESKNDLDYVASFCKDKDILFEGEQVDVSTYKKRHHLSTSTASRICRYRFFRRVMETYQADSLALAHHGDDQIETMLMRQVRGSFGTALAGIPVKRPFSGGQIIRPFLTLTKDQIEDYCRQKGIQPRRDLSNDSDDYTRNRFRKQVLPFLKQENPLVHLRFQQESEMLTDDDLYLSQLAEKQMNDILLTHMKGEVAFSIEAFLQIPVPLQRRVIHLILNYLYDSEHNDSLHQSIHIDMLIDWLHRKQSSGQQHLPHGLAATRSYDLCRLCFYHGVPQDENYELTLAIPGIIETPIGNISAEVRDAINAADHQGLNHFVCDFSTVQTPVKIRTRLDGDRVGPKGMEGTQKIKDIFINAKVDRKYRSLWPVVIDADGTVLWLPLLKYSRTAPINTGTSKFLVLTFIPTVDLGRQMQ
ncbi:tRNA(Ile)-lysidine synthase [Scopulibacillus darangshiensis]|uniref:tRNA(Ile)-lysidine synthase n=2 Tax=Scopulibacillus darangshiensis TaxID=442528 RepID=A0A4R2NLM7_9BACL|nr:tRNA(Ile)-lysidine synthase [Scopulibacillus darangshiensis]